MSPLDRLLAGALTVGSAAIVVREVAGSGLGTAGAVGSRIAVDVGGAPLLQAGDHPSAVLYLLYGAFCAWGSWTWLGVRRTPHRTGRDVVPEEVAA